MAGIPGMGSPSKLQEPVPQPVPPETSNFPTMNLENPGQFQVAPSAPAETPDEDLSQFFTPTSSNDDAEMASFFGTPEQAAPQVGYGQELIARAKASFGGSAEQKQKILEEIYGKGNITRNGDDLYFKKDGKDEKITRGALDMLGDAFNVAFSAISPMYKSGDSLANLGRDFADLTKPIVSEAAALPAELAGGLTGGPIGLAAGRVVGGAAGEVAATKLGEAIGAPYSSDGNDSLAARAAVMGGTRALFGAAADKLGSLAASRIGAARAAREIPTVDTVAKDAISDLQNAVNVLDEYGIDTKVPTVYGKVAYLPEQAVKASDLAPAVIKNAPKESVEYQRVNNALQERASNAIKSVNDMIGGASVRGRQSGVGEKFLKYADDIDKAEGQLIGEFREKAAQEAGDGLVVASNLKNKLQEIGQRVGLDAETKMTPENVIKEGLAGTEAEAKAFVSIYQDLFNKASEPNGRITMKDLKGLYDRMGFRTKSYWTKDDPYANSLKDLWRSVRDDYTQGVNVLLDEGKIKSFSPKSYEDALARFGEIKDASSALKGVLGKSAITQEALASQIFGGGSNSLQTLQATKSLLKDTPELWNQIRQTQLDKYFDSAFNPKTGRVDGNKYFKSIQNLPKEIQSELVGGPQNLNLLKAANTYANRIQNYSVKNFAEDEVAKKTARDAVGFLTSNLKYKFDAVTRLLSFSGKDRALAKYLSGPGQKEILTMLPTSQRSAATQVIDAIIESANNLPQAAKIEVREALTPNLSDDN